jgi:hypothetical protein
MGERVTARVSLPVWLITLLATIFLSMATFTIIRAEMASADHTQIQVNTKVLNEEVKPELKRLELTKADKEDISEIKGDIKEIKQMLIDHMSKPGNR